MNTLNTSSARSLAAAAAFATFSLNAALADSIRTERVTFSSAGETLVGNLYIPVGVNTANPRDAVIVTGAWTTIKEQMPALYARKLAERGYVALAFDFRTWGESTGTTRSLEDPAMKIADIKAAARFLRTRPEIADVNGLGICASAGYMATAAERSSDITSIALVAPWLHNAEIVNSVYGGPEGVQSLIATGKAAAANEAKTGNPQLITAAGPTGSDALMAFDGYYTDSKRGLVPAWENTFNVASWQGWLTFDAIRAAAGISQPTLIVHSDAGAIPQGAKSFFERLSGPKSQVWLDGVTQFDFYDRPDAVTSAVNAAAAHFARS